MKFIVGLGNPGEKYLNNRHNIGYMLLDFLIKRAVDDKRRFTFDKKLEAEVARVRFYSREMFLVKPQTYMNKSGTSVRRVYDYYKVPIDDIVVVHDDLDLNLGKFKIQQGRGPRLHNGIESVEKHLRTKDFLRVRVGVDSRDGDRTIPGQAYVLADFTPEERATLKSVFKGIFEKLTPPE